MKLIDFLNKETPTYGGCMLCFATYYNDGEKTKFDLTSSTIHRKNGEKHKYSIEEVDAFICYDICTKELFLVKNNGDMTSIMIRYSLPKNNQKEGINFHTDYTLCIENLHKVCLEDKEKV